MTAAYTTCNFLHATDSQHASGVQLRGQCSEQLCWRWPCASMLMISKSHYANQVISIRLDQLHSRTKRMHAANIVSLEVISNFIAQVAEIVT